jgi:hypothetical protein
LQPGERHLFLQPGKRLDSSEPQEACFESTFIIFEISFKYRSTDAYSLRKGRGTWVEGRFAKDRV